MEIGIEFQLSTCKYLYYPALLCRECLVSTGITADLSVDVLFPCPLLRRSSLSWPCFGAIYGPKMAPKACLKAKQGAPTALAVP